MHTKFRTWFWLFLTLFLSYLMPLIISLTCIHFMLQGQYSGIGTKEVLFITIRCRPNNEIPELNYCNF